MKLQRAKLTDVSQRPSRDARLFCGGDADFHDRQRQICDATAILSSCFIQKLHGPNIS